MKVSLNSIKGFNKRNASTSDIAPHGADALAEKIGAQLGAIEATEYIGDRYRDIFIVKVVHCEKLKDSDHLNRCIIDDSGKVKNVERNEEGLVQVLTGAPNVHEGMLAVWLPPGTTVPESIGKEPFVLEARSMRGAMSYGMLASLRELALGDEHQGILEINDPLDRVHAGDGFADAFGLKGDVIFDIENKMFTHRPDCFGFLGVSRELAGIQGMPFKSPDWYKIDAQIPELETEPLALEVHNEIPELVPRFTVLALKDVQVGPSPTWLVVELAKLGLRTINNVVDYTNFFMLETGQPIHAYDYDKVAARSKGDGAVIEIRHPHEGEKITLMNGKTITARPDDMMVATDAQLICVGGAIGGAETEVDEQTRNIIIEAANWDMYAIRKTTMAHGIFTDAVTRFNKGQSPLQNRAVIARITREIRRFDGGKVASVLIDVSQLKDRRWIHPPVTVAASFINDRLGFKLSPAEMKTILENVECSVLIDGDTLTVTAPFWRTDIELREDVVEEVGRLYGFEKLPLDLPRRTIQPVQKNELFELKSNIRSKLAGYGANEVLTYSFVHGDLLRKVGQNPDEAFQVSNALSPDLQYYKVSLTPSLLDKLHVNVKAGYDKFALFEIGKAHGRSQVDDNGLPKEYDRLAFVIAADGKLAQSSIGSPFYDARRYLEELLRSYGVWNTCRLVPAVHVDWDVPPFFVEVTKPFDLSRSAVIYVGDRALGIIGEYAPTVRGALKLPAYSAGFEFGLTLLQSNNLVVSDYEALPRYPKVTQDITFKVSADVSYAELDSFVRDTLQNIKPKDTRLRVSPLDIFQRNEDPQHKHVTFRVEIASYEKTLRDTEVNKLLDKLSGKVGVEFTAERA